MNELELKYSKIKRKLNCCLSDLKALELKLLNWGRQIIIVTFTIARSHKKINETKNEQKEKEIACPRLTMNLTQVLTYIYVRKSLFSYNYNCSTCDSDQPVS